MKISQCPTNLNKLINEANSLPKNYVFPSEIGVLAYGGRYIGINTLPVEQRKQMFADAVRDLPLEFTKLHSWIEKVVNRQTVTFDKSFKNSPQKMYRQLFKDEKYWLRENYWYET